ncbi:MAG: hypothetical protein KGS45_09300 [Planctomycetes bacterium]|nr:hypothetical protein [Planctomycetota bacterium]
MSRPLSTFRLESEVVHRSSIMRRHDEVSLVISIGDHIYSQTDPARTDNAGTLEGWSSEVLKHGPQMKSKALFDADFEIATQSVLHAEFDPDADIDAARQFIGEDAWISAGTIYFPSDPGLRMSLSAPLAMRISFVCGVASMPFLRPVLGSQCGLTYLTPMYLPRSSLQNLNG